ncbi:hypothetical protein B7R25_13810 [Subtercola boreus]|uniref:Uncharacterized protein n=1 Tax=Subtercola boreus TaxID=120213 RepID=A0A3E0W8L5_9MICO|nr:hypothetical protein B7R24_13710 [Subtercola boreus]RFA18909.1 hypothetical protein B7R23_13700 [Subtercola boreus]RFA25446.1 hypothetical protein B7R25_13810 [Subtercola boreus]
MTFPSTQADAARRAASAAAGDGQWQTLATDMATLVSIGSEGSASAVAQGQELFTDLSTRCGDIGVTVSAG